MTPLSLLNNTITQLEKIAQVCEERRVYILGPLPRYLLRSCCDNTSHCSNVRGQDEGTVDSCMKILNDTLDLNFSLEKKLTKGRVRFVNTSQLLLGMEIINMDSLMETLIATWSSDPVHGDKMAYSKIAISLMTLLKKGSIEPGGQGLAAKKM